MIYILGVKRSWKEKDPRIKRDIKITPSLHLQLNEEDERGNAAIEEVSFCKIYFIFMLKYHIYLGV